MLKVKAFGLAFGILWAISVAWCFLIAMWGVGDAPFHCVNQLYFGFLTPDVKGLVIGTVVGFVDGFIAGAVFAWIYNKCGGCCCSKEA